MILNIRGTSGSGKSYVVYQALRKYGYEYLKYEGKIIGTKIGPIATVGKYDPERFCGGCDTVKKTEEKNTQEIVCDIIRILWEEKMEIILFEGLITSGIFGRFHELDKQVGGIVWGFLDTPIEVCIERTKQRSLVSGKGYINEEHVINKFKQVQSARKNAISHGLNVVDIDYKRSVAEVSKILGVEI